VLRAPKRVAVSNIDRLVFAGLYHLAPEVLDAVKILKPETIMRWHRTGFRAGWRWKSRPRGGRPRTPDEIRQFIRDLGMDVGQTTVAKYIAKRRRPPSQDWRTFVHNHADAIASIDMFVVPTISFGLLYGLLILRQSRRELLWLGVTSQCGSACPSADRGLRLGRASTLLDPRPRRRVWRCLHPTHPAMGIRDRPSQSYQKYYNEVRAHLSLQKDGAGSA
jgi:hypothetical protein